MLTRKLWWMWHSRQTHETKGRRKAKTAAVGCINEWRSAWSKCRYSCLCARQTGRFWSDQNRLKAANEPGTHRSLSHLPLSSPCLPSLRVSRFFLSFSASSLTLWGDSRTRTFSKGSDSKGKLNWYSGAALMACRRTANVSHLRVVTWVLVIK